MSHISCDYPKFLICLVGIFSIHSMIAEIAKAQIIISDVDTTIVFDQKVKSNNPIIFGEFSFGVSKGILFGAEMNYQIRSSLFTARITSITDFETEFLGLFVPIPIFTLTEQYYEPALLYGYRYVNKGHSLSASGGLSYNNKIVYHHSPNIESIRYEYIGFPFELNYKFFNDNKKRWKIMNIFPVGKPTSFSRSVGFKVTGNISKFSYVGAGITVGLGYHKFYEE